MKIKLQLTLLCSLGQVSSPSHLCLALHPFLSPQSPTCAFLIIFIHAPISNHLPLSSCFLCITCPLLSSSVSAQFPCWDFSTGFPQHLLYNSVVNVSLTSLSKVPVQDSYFQSCVFCVQNWHFRNSSRGEVEPRVVWLSWLSVVPCTRRSRFHSLSGHVLGLLS